MRYQRSALPACSNLIWQASDGKFRQLFAFKCSPAWNSYEESVILPNSFVYERNLPCAYRNSGIQSIAS